MTRFLLVSALALGTATAAQAGNLAPSPVEPPVAAPVAPIPVAHDWTGAYAGLGLTHGRSDLGFAPDPAAFPDGTGTGLSGLVGYTWQSGAMVYGLEGHLGIARLDGSSTVGPSTFTTELDGLASIRGRVGVAADRTLFFATLGAAAGRLTHSEVGVDSQSRTVNGAVLGLGVEHALSQGLSIRGDLEHYRFQDSDFTTGGGAFPNVQTRANVARLSAVFRF